LYRICTPEDGSHEPKHVAYCSLLIKYSVFYFVCDWRLIVTSLDIYIFFFFSFWICFVNLLVYAVLFGSVAVKYECKYKRVYSSGCPSIVRRLSCVVHIRRQASDTFILAVCQFTTYTNTWNWQIWKSLDVNNMPLEGTQHFPFLNFLL
jgi:hypothetical protein